LTPADLNGWKDTFVFTGRRFLSERGLAESSAQRLPAGSVLFSSRAPIGYVAIAGGDLATNQGFKSVVPHDPRVSRYLAIYLRAVSARVDEAASGTTFKEVSGRDVARIQIAVPPLTEQEEIVKKVDALDAACELLETTESRVCDLGSRLTKASLEALTTAETPEEFALAWKRVSENFDTLIDRSEKVEDLRKAILAHHFSVRANSLKLSELCHSITDGDHQAPPRADAGIPFLTIGNLSSGAFSFEGCRFVPVSYYEQLDKRRTPQPGDVLYTVVGSFGIPLSVVERRQFCVQRHIAILRPRVNQRYLELLLSSPQVYAQAKDGATGIAQPTVGLGVLRSIQVPNHNSSEQASIVERLERLLTLCNHLENKLRAAEKLAAKFAESVVRGVTA
jgi:type I restriction enzyme S subunit